jgi:hypothetical protein
MVVGSTPTGLTNSFKGLAVVETAPREDIPPQSDKSDFYVACPFLLLAGRFSWVLRVCGGMGRKTVLAASEPGCAFRLIR